VAVAFNISNWLLRRRIDTQARTSGQPVEYRRISNPYHAVSIEAGPQACAAARNLKGERILSVSAPMLPLPGCDSTICKCRYSHFNDRRAGEDRRSQFPNPHAHQIHDRRLGTGRRVTD
jgi:hypothetical protein